MGVTISTHNGSSVAREHNLRNRNVTDKEAHIEPNGTYEIWLDEKPREAYERIFGKALADYNAKQTRSDRKIKSYYNTIKQDAKKHTVYEMIIGIYGRTEEGTPICDEKLGKNIMSEFVRGWKDRNPNLELIGAYYHADEEGEPHVHLDYVPVAHGYTNGLEVQNGLVKALGEMGFEKQGRATAQIQWEARENAHLDKICKARGLEVDHPKEQRKHLETKLYKATKELETVVTYTADLDNRIQRQEKELKEQFEQMEKQEQKKARLKDEIKGLKGERKEQKDLKKEVAGRTLFGRPRDKVTINYEEYRSLQTIARSVQELEKEKERAAAKSEELANREKQLNEMTKQTKIDREQAQKMRERQENYIKASAVDMFNQAMDGTPSNKEKRMRDFMDKVKYSDGTSVLEEFDKQEKELERSLKAKAHSWGR